MRNSTKIQQVQYPVQSRYKSTHYFSHEFPLAISQQKPQGTLALHAHDFVEMVIITAGSGIHYTQTEEHAIRSGDAFVIPPGRSHGYKNTRSLHLMNILFDLSWFDRLTAEIPKKPGFYSFFVSDLSRSKPSPISRLHMTPGQFKIIQPLLARIQSLMSAKIGSNNLAAAGLLLEIIGYLSTYYKSDVTKPISPTPVDVVMEFIETNHANEITLTQLADIAKISTRNLLRLFRNATGTTPIDYLLRYRISRSCRLLAETDLPVTKIAFGVGFTDGNYFCRQFKKIVRISPAKYRTMQAML